MTELQTTRLVRCERCGRHRPAGELHADGAGCTQCSPSRAATPAVATTQGERRSSGEARAGWPRPKGPELAARVRDARASWHRCDGIDVHPRHRELHRRGFWTEAHRVIAFIEGFCVFPEGPRRGEPADVVPFWREILFELYRLRDTDGRRQHIQALIGLPKKNAKSTMVAWLALYHTVADDEPSPRNVCAAANEDQADLVFAHAKAVVEGSPRARVAQGEPGASLQAVCEVWEREILVSGRDASLRRLASGGGNLDGPNLHLRALDELHEWRTPKNLETYRVLFQGGTLRARPLFLMITTAGWDRDSLCYRLYEEGRASEGDPDSTSARFFLWFEPPELASGEWEGHGPHERAAGEPLDYRSQEAWQSANPGGGQIPNLIYERYREDLETDPEMTEAVARRYRLNQWTDTEETWLPAPWSSYATPGSVRLRPGDRDEQRRVVAGVDASTRRDSTAITVWEAEGPPDELRVHSRSWVWQPPVLADGRPDEDWRLPQQEVKAHLYAMHFGTQTEDFWSDDGRCVHCGERFEAMGFEAVGYDPSRITMQTDVWEQDGLPMVEVPQTDQRMVPGFQTWFDLLQSRSFEHDGDPLVEQHVRNSAVKWAASGGRRLDRRHSSRRRPNDAAVAQVICAYLVSQPAPPEPPGVQIYF